MGKKKKVKGKSVHLRRKVKQAVGVALGSEATQAGGKLGEDGGKVSA
jgi:hypothetical protein